MIGVIVTGHGQFASGLTTSLELIAGKQKEYIAIDFDGVISQDDLLDKINKATDELVDCDGIIIFTDLIGGTPFKMAATATLEKKNNIVLSGTNLGMLIECCMTKAFNNDVELFASQILETGKSQVIKFEIPTITSADDEDGI
ncbi:PTS galactosamine/N-acetylgalactosamine transporter subunit IIA [Mycoplasmatota bacterium WC44]